VLQLIGPTDFKQSAFRQEKDNGLRLVAYNFGDKPARGKLKLDGATMANATSDEIQIAPGGREERTLNVDAGPTVNARLDSDVGVAVVAARLTKAAATAQPRKFL
jgi:hypothetical protein